MNTNAVPTVPSLPESEADALLIATGLSHLTEDYYVNEETGSHCYELEDGRSVEITAAREVFLYDGSHEGSDGAPQKLDVQPLGQNS